MVKAFKKVFGGATGGQELDRTGAVVDAMLMGRNILMSPKAVARVTTAPAANATKPPKVGK